MNYDGYAQGLPHGPSPTMNWGSPSPSAMNNASSSAMNDRPSRVMTGPQDMFMTGAIQQGAALGYEDFSAVAQTMAPMAPPGQEAMQSPSRQAFHSGFPNDGHAPYAYPMNQMSMPFQHHMEQMSMPPRHHTSMNQMNMPHQQAMPRVPDHMYQGRQPASSFVQVPICACERSPCQHERDQYPLPRTGLSSNSWSDTPTVPPPRRASVIPLSSNQSNTPTFGLPAGPNRRSTVIPVSSNRSNAFTSSPPEGQYQQAPLNLPSSGYFTAPIVSAQGEQAEQRYTGPRTLDGRPAPQPGPSGEQHPAQVRFAGEPRSQVSSRSPPMGETQHASVSPPGSGQRIAPRPSSSGSEHATQAASPVPAVVAKRPRGRPRGSKTINRKASIKGTADAPINLTGEGTADVPGKQKRVRSPGRKKPAAAAAPEAAAQAAPQAAVGAGAEATSTSAPATATANATGAQADLLGAAPVASGSSSAVGQGVSLQDHLADASVSMITLPAANRPPANADEARRLIQMEQRRHKEQNRLRQQRRRAEKVEKRTIEEQEETKAALIRKAKKKQDKEYEAAAKEGRLPRILPIGRKRPEPERMLVKAPRRWPDQTFASALVDDGRRRQFRNAPIIQRFGPSLEDNAPNSGAPIYYPSPPAKPYELQWMEEKLGSSYYHGKVDQIAFEKTWTKNAEPQPSSDDSSLYYEYFSEEQLGLPDFSTLFPGVDINEPDTNEPELDLSPDVDMSSPSTLPMNSPPIAYTQSPDSPSSHPDLDMYLGLQQQL